MVIETNSYWSRSTAGCAVLLVAAFAASSAAAQGNPEELASTSTELLSCLAHPTIDRTKVLNNRNIVFVTRNDTIYNNELPKQCPSLKRNSLVNYGIANGRLCAGDRFQILWEATPGNYLPTSMCQLGSFRAISATEYEDLLTMTEEHREKRRRGRSSREAVTSEQVELPRAETTPADSEIASPAE